MNKDEDKMWAKPATTVCLSFSVYSIAVYDLGGGTFDISILEIQKGVFEVTSTLLQDEAKYI